jgi:hypothetical protein
MYVVPVYACMESHERGYIFLFMVYLIMLSVAPVNNAECYDVRE